MKEAAQSQTTASLLKDNPVYIVDGLRTPYLRARGQYGPFSAADLAVYAGRELISRLPIRPTDVDETVIGCIMPSENEANIGRIIGLRLGCGEFSPGWTVQRNCGSGMQAIDSAMKDILLGRHDLVLVGGTEAMSRAPIILQPKMADWLASFSQAKSVFAKMKLLGQLRPAYLKPIIALICGLTDPLVGMIMGKTAEEVAFRFNITREEMDAYALRSHQRLAHAQDEGYFDNEVVTIYDNNGHFYSADDGVRRDTSMEKLAKIKPFFDKKFGMVTAANSSQVTDGAAMLVLANENAVKKYKLPVLGRILDANWGAIAPEIMGLGPVMATTPMLVRNNLTFNDIEYMELNEAFAAQVLGCLHAWNSDEFCREYLGLPGAFGSFDQERLNVDGGAVAIGHPVGSSGARIALHLLNVLKRKNAKLGVATICIGGGQGGAMLLERV